jgi:hypothetical protein
MKLTKRKLRKSLDEELQKFKMSAQALMIRYLENESRLMMKKKMTIFGVIIVIGKFI